MESCAINGGFEKVVIHQERSRRVLVHFQILSDNRHDGSSGCLQRYTPADGGV